jgi:hypothetical protein
MPREFEELAFDGHNYPTWALDVKISLAFRGILLPLSPPMDREGAFLDTFKYQALFIIQNHLHPDLKLEYVIEEEPHSLWVTLQGCYEQQKAIVLLEANHEWPQIRLQNFKSIEDYNHSIHKVCAKLWFCEKEPLKEDKIKRHFKLCFLLIGSYNINIGSETTNAMLTSFVIYSRLRSMMSLILKIITNIMLGLLLSLRFITMRRSLTFSRIIIRRKMVGPLGADAVGVKTGNLQRQWKGWYSF